MKLFLYALIGMGLCIPSVHARPVSYPGGWTLMLMNDGEKNTAHIHYSPTAKTSLGYKFEYLRDKEVTLHTVQMNNLIKRWNKKDSQANLYLKSGLGLAHSNRDVSGSETQPAGFIGIATDWEDRRYFTSYENRYMKTGDFDDSFSQTARVGWAPYEGDYGDLHTWLMLQIDHAPESRDEVTVTPLVRMFKGVHLVEAGMNNNGEVLFNYVIRY